MKVCAQPGCGELTRTTRCPEHTRSKDRERGTRQQRGYDAGYEARRDADLAALARGEVLTCWRCGRVVFPHDYSLGHCDDDRSVIHGPEHLRKCNLSARGACTHPAHADPQGRHPPSPSREDRGRGVSGVRRVQKFQNFPSSARRKGRRAPTRRKAARE